MVLVVCKLAGKLVIEDLRAVLSVLSPAVYTSFCTRNGLITSAIKLAIKLTIKLKS